MSIKKITLLLVTLVVLLFSATIFVLPSIYGKPDNSGIFGDMFGSVNALFSGLAFIGLITTILLQKEELELQRKDLALTRKELEGQKNQLKTQNETLRKQTFENTFFQLLGVQIDIINSIDLSKSTRKGQSITSGRDCFVEFYKILENQYKPLAYLETENAIIKTFEAFDNSLSYELNHYYRHLYRVYDFVDASKIDNKTFYCEIVNSILSDQELLILFYYALSNVIDQRFKDIILKYQVFKQLPLKKLLDPKHIDIYKTFIK